MSRDAAAMRPNWLDLNDRPCAKATARKHGPASRKRIAARKIGGTTSEATFMGSHVSPQMRAIRAKAAMRLTLNARRQSFRVPRTRLTTLRIVTAGGRAEQPAAPGFHRQWMGLGRTGH